MQSSWHISKYFDVLDAEHGIFTRKESVGRALKEDAPADHSGTDLSRYLEEELYHTKERLQLAVNEYETTHDDLVDLNHELQSSVRGVVLEKDQLQAEHKALLEMKDGILKANKEFKKQNDRLRSSVARLEGVMAQSGVGMLYLNSELGIELFTPGVGSLFGLKRSDIGRPFSSIEMPFNWKMAEDVERVIRKQTGVEREEHAKDGQWYRIIVNPFNSADTIRGVVCTFVDITEERRSVEWARYKASVLEHMTDSVLMTNRELKITYMNQAAINRYDLHDKKKSGILLSDLYRSVWKNKDEKEAAHRALSEKGRWSGEHFHVTSDGRQTSVDTSIHLLTDESGQELGMLTVVRDVKPKKNDDTDSLRALISDLERRSDVLDQRSGSVPVA